MYQGHTLLRGARGDNYSSICARGSGSGYCSVFYGILHGPGGIQLRTGAAAVRVAVLEAPLCDVRGIELLLQSANYAVSQRVPCTPVSTVTQCVLSPTRGDARRADIAAAKTGSHARTHARTHADAHARTHARASAPATRDVCAHHRKRPRPHTAPRPRECR